MSPPARRPTAVATLDPPGEAHCCPHLHEAVELIGKRWTGAIIVVLIEAGPTILPAFPASLRDSARRALRKLGVEVWEQATVTDIQAASGWRLSRGMMTVLPTIELVGGALGATRGSGAIP